MSVQLRNEHDAFLSHASEDKDLVARPLVKDLQARGYRIWFDEHELKVGDSLTEAIDRGLARSRMGIVVVSPAFLRKKWPQRELRGLVAKEMAGDGKILPVWHDVTHREVAEVSPPLADLFAANTREGMTRVADQVARALGYIRDAALCECYLHSVEPELASLHLGDQLSVSYEVVNPGAVGFSLYLGASLLSDRGHELVDPNNDAEAIIEPQGVARHERAFRLPPNMTTGRYRLVGALWLGPPGPEGHRIHTRSSHNDVLVEP